MAKESSASFLSELFKFDLYKASQGKITRQVTFVALAVTFLLAALRLYFQLKAGASGSLNGTDSAMVYLPAFAAGGLLLLGGWLSYRAVNFPKFADFLIAVEAEMNKVTWPSRGELVRSSIVVIFVILAMAGLLFGYDVLWKFVFTQIGILKSVGGGEL